MVAGYRFNTTVFARRGKAEAARDWAARDQAARDHGAE
jgi:nitrogen fixation protein FixH